MFEPKKLLVVTRLDKETHPALERALLIAKSTDVEISSLPPK